MFRLGSADMPNVSLFSPPDIDDSLSEELEAPDETVGIEIINRAKLEAERILEDAYKEKSTQIKSANEKAERIIADAQLQADKILEKAASDSEEQMEEAKRKGYADGQEAAEVELERQLQEQTAEFKHALHEIDKARDLMYEELDGEIRELVLQVTKKIINLAGEKNDTIFECLVKNAIENLRPNNEITLHVSPEDFEKYFPDGSHLFTLDNGKTVTASIVSDKTLGMWDCTLEDEGIVLDAGLDSQLRFIKIAFERSSGETGNG